MSELPIVLILSSPKDIHALAVCNELRQLKLAESVIVDTSRWPGDGCFEVRPGKDLNNAILRFSGVNEKLQASQIVGVWWRRPTGFGVHEIVKVPFVQDMVRLQGRQLFYGLFNDLDIRHMNDPANEARASWKLYQLQVASEVGLNIPQTLMTDDPEAARKFIEKVGDVVYKPFQNPVDRLLPTRRITPQALRAIDKVRLAPVIFQSRIPRHIDLRVTIVGQAVFSAGSPYRDLGMIEDNRIGPRKFLEPHELPQDITRKIHLFMERLGLIYGALDFCLTKNGDYIFFEVNPAGQYLWVEIETQLPISAAIARWLSTGHSLDPKTNKNLVT